MTYNDSPGCSIVRTSETKWMDGKNYSNVLQHRMQVEYLKWYLVMKKQMQVLSIMNRVMKVQRWVTDHVVLLVVEM